MKKINLNLDGYAICKNKDCEGMCVAQVLLNEEFVKEKCTKIGYEDIEDFMFNYIYDDSEMLTVKAIDENKEVEIIKPKCKNFNCIKTVKEYLKEEK